MHRIKLTVKRLYKINHERMVNARASVRIYVGDTLIATEDIAGMTESPVSKVLCHHQTQTQPLRVEWECDGIADMTVTACVDPPWSSVQ